jgi:DNA-binding MarR family transcriptional regulator
VNVNWMVGYNERKLQVLEYVKMRRATTSSELAGALNLEVHNARTLLKKYSRQGLLSRSRADAWGTRVHEITEKGLRRLSYLKGTESSGLVRNSP